MQQPKIANTGRLKPIVIEVSGEPVGVVVPHEEAFRFLAVKFPVFGIDGQTFPSIEEARLAASNVVGNFEAGQDNID